MYKKSGTGFVLVETDALYKVDSGRKGIDGKPIIIDTVFNPINYIFNFATACQVPLHMGSNPISQKPVGSPGYGPIRRPADLEEACSTDLYAIGGVYQYKYVSDILPEVEIGDKIYFKNRTLNTKANQMGVLLGEDRQPKKYFYKVPYENIFCAVKPNGRIVCIGSWTLLAPILEDWQDIYKKTYYDLKDREGNRIERPREEWIKLKASPEHDSMRGKVAHIGKPLKGEVCDIKEGQTVVFKKLKTVHLSEIEGKKYIVLLQDQILARLRKDVKIS